MEGGGRGVIVEYASNDDDLGDICMLAHTLIKGLHTCVSLLLFDSYLIFLHTDIISLNDFNVPDKTEAAPDHSCPTDRS